MNIPLSALQHYAFCTRQCALIYNGQQAVACIPANRVRGYAPHPTCG